jgi:hypothetical protein
LFTGRGTAGIYPTSAGRRATLSAALIDVLSVDELDELIAGLEPIAAAAQAADD